MATYKFGSWVYPASYGFRPFLAYTVKTNNDTTYTLTLFAGVQCSTTDAVGYNGISLAVAGTGQKSKSVTANFRTASADSSARQTFISSWTWTWTKGTSAASKTITVTMGGSVSSSTVTFTFNVPAKTHYTVTYNANGGTAGSVTTQTKWYGQAMTISASATPTRTGWTFVGWGTSAAATAATYSAGGSYTANAGATLYAIWKKTITVTYDANQGSGEPSSQSATIYNATTAYTFTLSSAIPSRTNYRFLGWASSSTATAADYSAGQQVTFSDNKILYAVWELAYILPTITDLKAFRVSSATPSTDEIEGGGTDDGRYIYVSFAYTGGSIGGVVVAPSCEIQISDGTQSGTYTPALSSSPFSRTYGTYSADAVCTVSVTLYDENDLTGTTKTFEVGTAIYPIDLKADDNGGVYMGVMTPAVAGQTLKLFVDAIYPVGSYYETSDTAFDPNTYFGGTWALEAEGLVHVSGDPSGTYNAGDIGGSTTHQHTTGDHALTTNELPSHTHRILEHYNSGTVSGYAYSTVSGNAAWSTTRSQATGGGAAHNHGDTGTASNMPPYIVVHRWHRTA